jgi:aminoglycoside phosphotransferase (APT) family kinase protein
MTTAGLDELLFAQAREHLRAAGVAVREKHSGGASSLLAGAEGGELVVHHPLLGAPRTWRYPADPALAHLADVPGLLAAAAWDPPLPPALAGAAVERRLMYNPGRRAAFRLRPSGGGAPVVLRLLSAVEAPASLRALRAVAASGLLARIPMPRPIAAAPAAGAVLLDFLPGAPVTEWTPAVLDGVAGVLAAVHGTDLPDVPAWTARRDVAKLERLLALLALADERSATTLRPAAAALAERLAAEPARTTAIHRDFTARHVLLVPDGAGAPRVGVLDWDSVSTGPPEKDLATLAASLGPAAAGLLDRYEAVSGCALDRRLVAALVQAQRLTRACRRLLAGERPPAWAAGAAGEVMAALDGGRRAAA